LSTENNNHTKRKTKRELEAELIEIRREKCLELYMSGLPQQAIGQALNVSQATISLDLAAIRIEAQSRLNNIIEKELPLQWIKTRTAIQFMQREALRIFHEARTDGAKLEALKAFGLAQREEFELVSNSHVLDKCMQYVFDMKNKTEEQQQEGAAVNNELSTNTTKSE
jgi:hypothetical protein